MPSVSSIRCIEARSICEYDSMAATSPEMRWVDSFISESKAAMENVLATHSSPGSRAGPASDRRRPLAPGEIDPGGSERRGDVPVACDAMPGQPRGQDVLVVG